MNKTLIIVESPAKAATIQKYLGTNYIVVASMGHINELASGTRYGLGVDVNKDFKASYTLMKDRVSVLDGIIQAAEQCDNILLASDPDREGEAIAYHIQTYLLTTGKPIKRIEFIEMTKTAIQKAAKNPRDIDMNLFHSQEARRILDRLVGYMVSPFLMNYYGNNLSAGRVQSVATRMIVDREAEIAAFKPEEFWNIYAKFKNGKNEIVDTKLQARPTNKADAAKLVELAKNSEFYIGSVASQKKSEKPCAPMITASLQQYMAKKFGYEPERTMKAAQTLYENGYCTYIRTDSTRISDEAIIPVRDWIEKNGFGVPKKPHTYMAKASAQDAHECIRPTNVSNLPDGILTGDDKEVYTVIWKHFVACQMNPAIWDTMTVSIVDKNKKLSFVASGKALAEKGFLEIFGEIDPGKIEIPFLTKGDILLLDKVKSEQKFTQPPPRYNVASILKELEAKQIGRPSSYADIIKKISSRDYVEKSGNTYKPTELGKKITNILTGLFPFMEYKYSSLMEQQLDDIAAGKLNYLTMLRDFFAPFREQLTKAYVSNGSGICSKCGNPTVIRTNNKDHSKFISCSTYPHCRNAQSLKEDTNVQETISS